MITTRTYDELLNLLSPKRGGHTTKTVVLGKSCRDLSVSASLRGFSVLAVEKARLEVCWRGRGRGYISDVLMQPASRFPVCAILRVNSRNTPYLIIDNHTNAFWEERRELTSLEPSTLV